MGFVKWVSNLHTEFIFRELTHGSTAEKKRLIQKISRIVADDTQLQFILQRQTIIEAPVQGIPYYQVSAALQVRVGDQLMLQAEPENEYDRLAVRVVYRGEKIGYVQRDAAKIVSREMHFGRMFRAFAKEVIEPLTENSFPQITLTITG